MTDTPAAPAPKPFDHRRFESAPCYLCGYNGHGYFQPSTHPCAAKYHAHPAPAVLHAAWERAERAEAEAAALKAELDLYVRDDQTPGVCRTVRPHRSIYEGEKMKRLVIDVEDEHIELDVASNFNMDPVRDLICSMVRRALGFDQYSQDVFVRVRVYKDEA